MSLDITKQRLSSSKDRATRFIDQNILIWGMEEILFPAQTDIRNSINERAANALTMEKTGVMKVELVWDLRGENDEPLHFYLEHGTQPHIIEPKKDGGVLAWKGPSGGFIIGKTIFAKRVNHPGSKKHVGLVQGITDERRPALMSRIISETVNKMEIDKIQ